MSESISREEKRKRATEAAQRALDEVAARKAAAAAAANTIDADAEDTSSETAAPAVAAAPSTEGLKSQITGVQKEQSQEIRVGSVQTKVDDALGYMQQTMDNYLRVMKPNGSIDPAEGSKAQLLLMNLVGKVLRETDRDLYGPRVEKLLKFFSDHKDTYFDMMHSHRFFDKVAEALGNAEAYRKTSDLLSAMIKLAPKPTRRLIMQSLPKDVAFSMLKQDSRERLVEYLTE